MIANDAITRENKSRKTDTKYVFDSSNPTSINNQDTLKHNFGLMNRVYDNGLQQIKPIELGK